MNITEPTAADDCLTKGHRYAPVDLRKCVRCDHIDVEHPGIKWWEILDVDAYNREERAYNISETHAVINAFRGAS